MFLFSTYPFKNPLIAFVVFLFDLIGSIFALPFRFLSNSVLDKDKIHRILVIRLDHLGDVIMTLPALDNLIASFPKAVIDLFVSKDVSDLFRDEKRMHIIPIENHWFRRFNQNSLKDWFQLLKQVKMNRYDLAIDFRGDLRHILLFCAAAIPLKLGWGITGGGFLLTWNRPYPSSLHQKDVNQRLLIPLQVEAIKERPLTVYPEKRSNFLQRFQTVLKLDQEQFRIVMHCHAGYDFKQWPLDSFQTLIHRILNQYAVQIILIGTAKEKEVAEGKPYFSHPNLIDIRGLTDLMDLICLFQISHLYVGNDSGPGHLAANQNLANIVIFGNQNQPDIWKPSANTIVLYQSTSSVDHVFEYIVRQIQTKAKLRK